jgi:hypothetical protein
VGPWLQGCGPEIAFLGGSENCRLKTGIIKFETTYRLLRRVNERTSVDVS